MSHIPFPDASIDNSIGHAWIHWAPRKKRIIILNFKPKSRILFEIDSFVDGYSITVGANINRISAKNNREEIAGDIMINLATIS